jgi:heme exporter protein C
MKFIYQTWWKVLAVVIIFYTLVAGFLLGVPRLEILHETIRNTYFHVPMWIAMFTVFTISVIYSIKYLQTGKEEYDLIAVECTNTGIFFFVLGLVTGMLWAKYTWGEFWSNDPKQNSAAIAFLLYCAYGYCATLLMRSKSAPKYRPYTIFSLSRLWWCLIMVLPRLTDSLHPGNGGNPAFGKLDMDNRMRVVLYPAFIAWALIGFG